MRMRWAGNITQMGKMGNEKEILVENPEEYDY
jgi:hypothetical protein